MNWTSTYEFIWNYGSIARVVDWELWKISHSMGDLNGNHHGYEVVIRQNAFHIDWDVNRLYFENLDDAKRYVKEAFT